MSKDFQISALSTFLQFVRVRAAHQPHVIETVTNLFTFFAKLTTVYLDGFDHCVAFDSFQELCWLDFCTQLCTRKRWEVKNLISP